ncbi:non-ribosomal peptide synthetase [Burkholderia pseudomallei]|uniref:non-ribosomal peptide synthetase n=165 Tax=Burkholderia pseudomallei TaxID=28450 RepID=UPI00050D37DA|nr:non-ribosomal peptide synthetase [Burkholderia pseudomallei]AIP53301.1 D-alanine--poly(phosphoribitol) ligase, subunit 1 [Burkholderia pseudomallei HBPUB10134a]
MNVNSLLDLLQRKNIRIHVDRDELVVRAPRGALNAELTQALKKSKAELIDVLRRRGAQASPDPVRITPAQLTLVALSQESIDALVTKVEGGAANVQDIYPLAPLQEGILFHHLMSGESDPYVLSGVLAFRGREVMERFVSALQQVIDRHDILRTGFFWEGLEQPVQVVQRRATLPVSVVELDAREGDIVRQLEARFDSRGYRMDVSRAPLMHVHAACDGEHERWVARVLFHHLSIDHTTLERVIEEARAIGQGRVENLPQPEPFRNFVAQARLGVSEADHEAYFRAKLGDIDEPTAPFGLLSVQGDGREIAEAARRLKPELSGALRGHARRLGVSAASMMHVAWGLVLSRTTGRQDVVFGTVLFGRMQGGAQSDRALGLFINTLPVRMRVAQTGVEASVKGTHAQLAELMRHEHAPLVLAQRCSGVPAQTPLFTSLLNYRYSKPKVAAAHIADGIELLDGHERTSYPLSVTVDDHERDFTIVAKVCERIGPQRVCELMELALEQLTRALSANPGGELAELDVLPAAERTQVLHGWNETGRAYARDACLHQLFEAQVSRTPEAAAVICGDETLSYTDLDARANRLAHYLRGQGVGPDTRVGLALGRGVEMMTGLLAILKAGGAYVPLDPGYASERLRAILDDSRPAIVLADAAGRTALDALAGAPPIADLHADASRWSALPSTPPRVEGLTPRHLAYVIYTSGSTGQPKGVMVEHASVVNLWRALDEAIYRTHPSARRVSLNASIAFDSLVKQWVQLLSGRTLVVVPEPVRFDGRRLLDAIGRDRIDVFDCTPSQLALIEGARGPEDEAYPQVTLVGGEAIGEGMWSELASASSRTYYNVYGPTECTVDATLARITAEHAPHIGGPLANVRAYVLNERLSPAPVGVRGELYIGGAGVARGYLNRPELTRERFIDDPFVAGGRLYKTGDLARWRADGRLEYLGRNDFQVKIRGFRIELGEIEAQLAKVTGVREVVVLARDSASAVHDSATENAAPDAPSPETATAPEKRLVAYYTGDADVAALRAQAAQHLPSYMVPSAYVRLDAWPLTPNGKLDRRALPAPADDAYARAEYEAPQGAKEEALAAIWKDLLPVERISRHDNFFELGGHSLLVIGLSEKLRAAGLHADVRVVYRASTLADLAAHLGTDNQDIRIPPNLIADGDEHITPAQLTLVALSQESIDALVTKVEGGAANVQDIYPLAPLQEGILFHHLMSGESDPYVLSGVLAFRSREVMERFVSALQQVIDRHDILRTGFFWEGLEQPVQVVQRRATLPVSVVELDAGEGDIVRQLEARFDSRGYRMDVSRAPLMHVHAACDGEHERWVARVLFHHLSIDHTTLERVIEEARAIGQGRVEDLPRPAPFRNFVAQARLGVSEADHEAYFRAKLGDIDEPTAPFGLLSVQGDGREIAEAARRLKPELSGALRGHARRLGVSAASMMHVAWGLVLSRTTGRQDVVFGTVLFGRMQGGAQSDRALGLFINTLPVRMRVAQTGVEASVKGTHAQLAELMRHEHAPLVLAQRCSGVPAQTPLFTSLLNYRYSKPKVAAAHIADGIELLDGHERTNYPVSVDIDDHGDDFKIRAQAAASVDPARVCDFLEVALTRLVDALERDPHGALRQLDILPEVEREEVVRRWNAGEKARPSRLCLHELFERQAARAPDAIAVIQDERALTYAELNRCANRLAHYLRVRGVRGGDRVALYARRSPELLIGMLATLKAGGAYVPLDPGYPAERLTHMLLDSAPVVVLRDAAASDDVLVRLNAGTPILDLHADDERWSAQPSGNLKLCGSHEPDVGARRLAYVIYTSGSTGAPKGVMVEHASVVNQIGALTEYLELDASDRVLQFSNIAFDASVEEIFATLSCGATLVLRTDRWLADAETFWALCGAQRISIVDLPAQFFGQLALSGRRAVPTGVRCVVIGGEAVGASALDAWFAEEGRRPRLFNTYGPTETTVSVTVHEVRGRHDDANVIGRPIANTRVYVLDAWLRPAPIGVAGELYIGGVQVARGYLNRPELTRERFIDDPFVTGGRLYRTGDLARWRTDGSLEYLGRNDFQVKIRGFRIELGEIEAQLAKVTGVREVVVLARDSAADTDQNADLNASATANSSEKRLVAYYTGDADVAALRAQAAQHLPSYMVPSAYVRLDAWPLTPNGKLDRRALPAPADDAYARAEYEAPQGAKEEALAAIWRELLHVERVSRHDNFFELGGHSLLAVQLVSRLRQALSVEVALSTVFDAPVLSALAERLEAENTAVLPPIPLAPRDGRIALSLAQQRLWFLTQLEGVSEAYHMSGAVRLDGPLNREVLQRALNRIVMRHEALRTCFAREEGEPIQVIQPHADLTVSYHDLREAEQSEQRAKDLSQAHASAPFDLSRDLPVRVLLLQLADEAHVVQVVMHHIASDGWSVGVFLQELSALYGSFIAEQGDPLAPLPLQYADYAAWQRRWLASGQLEKQGAFWQTNLSGAPTLLELPTDRPRPPKQSHAGASVEVKLGAALSERVKRLSQRHGVTPYMTLLSSWAAVLSRLSGQEEVVIGSPVAGRNRTEVEALIGFFVNTLALRLDLSSEPTVGELLKRTKAQVLSAQAHQDLPFDQVVERVKPPRSTAHPPLFQVMFVWQNMPAGELTIPGLTIRAVETPLQTAQFELTLSLREAGDDIVGHLNYASALFDESTVRRYVTYWCRLLEGMTAGPANVSVARLPLLDEAERKQVVYAWNATERDYPIEQCIHQLFEAQVDRKPEAIALTFEGQRLSYAELNARANRLAHYLQARGVGPGRLVALCAERGIEMVVGLLAILKAGGAYVPLDPAYASDRLRGIVEDSQPALVLADAVGRAALGELDGALPVIDLETDALRWREMPATNPEVASQHVHHLAYVIYTSGSTGRPKGVMVEHAQVVRLFGATQAWFGFDERDVWTLFHSYGFDFSVWEMWGALLHGGRLVIVPTEVTRTPSAFFALLCAEGVTVLNQTPSAFQALMSAQEEREEAAGNIERANVVAHRLRYVIFGGEALEPRTLASWYARHGERTQLVNMYGITETTVHVTYYALRAEDAMRLGASPIGVRIPDLQLYVLDARREPVPMGVTGELYVGGAGVARGYLNRPELTRERFIDDPFVAGGRLYKTGDLARWRTDGSLEYLGRNDFQVKIRGFRIELGEIEAQLAKVAGVREVVVLARDSAAEVRDSATEHATPNALSPSPETSTATAAATATATATATEKRLVAYYTGDADVAALRAQAAQHLPSYMVPSAYVRLDAWPLTPNGKLDRRALPAPADDAYARAEYEAPQGAKEEALAAIWRELLHVERVSRHDNFFELGGHSLLAIGVIERMRREGLHTDVRSIFNAQTLSDLAARAQTDDRSIQAPPNLIPARATRITPDMLPLVALTQTQIDMLAVQVEGGAANIQDIYPLAPLQEGMVFHHLLHAESDAYMEAYFVGFRTRARLDRFLDALRMIVDRHDILRTGFFWEGLEQPVQIVQRRVRLPIEFVDLDPADGDVLRQLEARHDPRAHRLDIRRPALLSCHAAHDPAAGRWLLCVMAHHLAIDNTSLKLLVAEEQAIEQGGFDALPPAPSFRNFIAQIASGVDRREHEAFFSAMLGDIDSPTHPFGLQDVQGDGREIAEFQQRLSPELSKAIRVCTRRLGVSPASLMHLAWAMVLSRATGRREAVFGTVLFGRMQGGERGMGMFINTLPIRIDVDERYVAECLAHTHERVVQLIYHEHAPLALALRCSGLPARQALFSSLLNYRHSEQAARPPRDDDDIQYLDGNERTNYPLTVSIDDLGEAFSVTVQARHPASPERIRAFMETALEQLVRALDGTSGVAAPGVVMPRIAVCDIDVLPSEERHRLLVEWNDTAADYPQDQCLHRLFEAQAARHPDTIALIADGEPVGYAELNRRANRLARHLSARGLQPDQRVAICIDRGIDMVVAMLAVLKAGGAYVPLDPAYPSERLDYLLRDCAPVALLTHARLGASMQTRLVLALARLDTGCALIDLESDAGAWRHERDDDPPPSGLTPRHLAYVIYTSGSTGQPKGVMVEHRSVCNLVAWHAGAFDVGTGCRSASVAGVAFDATTWEVWAALCNGGCLSLAPGDAASDPQALLRWWRAQELDVGFLVTPLAELAYATGQSNAGMRTLLIGGDRLSRWPDSMPPGQMLVNNYGPTEATVVATSGRLQPGEATPPIGRPIANTRVYVLDAWLRPAPIGVAGELYIGGVQVARGYLNRPELTRERFIDDPFVAGGRLYRTGDLARWRTDGSLEYLGRNDFQVKIRGFRIELGEIEAQLAKVADVREVVVLARDSAAEVHDSATEHATPNAPSPSPETTTATAAATATATAIEKRLVAYYTGDADVVALRAQAAQHLPSYMVPSAYVRLDAWPLTPNGKLDRRALPAPADDAYARAEYEAPQGAKEEALAAIWRELLHVERVSRHDNFFELGGHSLLAVQLVSRLRQALSVEVALGTVFDAPVLSALAERLEAENTAVLPPIPLAPRDGRIALSLAQQRLWFLTQLEGVSEAYHMSGAVRLDGPLNREVLQRALNRIVMRHEALRTCFAREEGEPIQVIQPHADLTVSYHDLREAEQSEQRAKDLSQAHASAPFDLSRDLPVRVLLLQLADEAHVVQVVMHHIASDGWSVGVFLQELSALYGSFIAKQDDPLAPLPLQYADYAAWQRRWLASGQLEKQGAFWQTNLSGAPTLLELPTDRPRPPKQSHAGASVEVKLGAALSERVKRLSQRHGVTPYMTLLSSWAAVLSRLSGQEEVVIGSPVAGRNRTEVEALIGFFVNTLALRLDLSSEPTVGELLKRTKAQVLSAQAHQDLPFDQVVERVKPPRSTAHPPLFQVMFDWHNTPARALTMPGLTVSVARTETTTSQYDLVLSMQERNGDIVGHLNYATALFDEQTARRYARYWRRLLEGMTAGSANVSVARLPLLDEAEREQVVHEWNATERAYPIRQCIHQLFEAQAARTPNAIAIGDERVTYAALNASANRLARHLRALGVVADTRVAVCIERGAPMVIALLAIWKAGGAYVPLDPAYPRERIAYMLRDSAPIAVLTSRASRDLVASHLPDRAPLVVIDAAACPWDALSGDDLDPNDIELNATHLCYVIYTSGSTGQPKGVMIEHRNLVNYTLDAIRWFGLGPGETVLQQNSLNFDLSLEEIVPALSSGAALAPAVELFGAGGSARGHSARPTMIHLTAAHWQQLVGEWHRAGARPAAALEGVRLVNVTGDALSPHKLEQWDAIRPAHTRLINTYGPTEITISCSAAYVRHAPGMSRVSIGRPFANSRMYLLDARGEPVPVGVTGELYIGGDGVARGYLNRPELSAERFVDDPFRPGSRMYKTGDLACRRGDGEIEFVGRNDFQVKVRGFRVELSEVETRLAAVDGVQEIAVLAREDAPGEKRLVAYYTGAAEMAALRECAARDLPAYMMPAAYVCLPALPLTPNGKLDRNALPPPAHDADSNRGYEAPQGDIEETLARIWEQLLERERVGRHDNFFDLGGHSLLTVSLIERMRQADLHADVAALFTTSTLAELAACTTKLKEILL